MDMVLRAKVKKFVSDTMAGAGAIKGEKGDPGPQGPPGENGKDGPAGAPGFSPTVAVEPIESGNKVTITDKDGPKQFDVMNGTDAAAIEDYTTDDGWHVRKYSDGYVEMDLTMSETILANEWTAFGENLVTSGKGHFVPVNLPITLVEKFQDIPTITYAFGSCWIGYESANSVSNVLLKTTPVHIVRPSAVSGSFNVTVRHFVTGRWK